MNSQHVAISNAIDYIEKHLKETLDMSHLAEHVGFSKFHFSRLFREVTGMNPYDYFRGRKVTEAILYMEKHQCKIIDVAFEFGFNSPEVFTRSCLTALGQTPSQIRKQLVDHQFEGIRPLNIVQIEALSVFSHLQPTDEILPTFILKGSLFTSSNLTEPLDFSNPNILQLVDDTSMLYVLNWQSKEDPTLFHHLVGTYVSLESFDIENDTDIFTHSIFKKIPTCTYLGFPLFTLGKEITAMNNYIYTHYLPNQLEHSTRSFNVEAIRFDSQKQPKDGVLYVPIVRKREHHIDHTK